MTLTKLIETTRKLASDVDVLASRVEEQGDDIRYLDEEREEFSVELDDARLAAEDAAALIAQALDLLDASIASLEAAELEELA